MPGVKCHARGDGSAKAARARRARSQARPCRPAAPLRRFHPRRPDWQEPALGLLRQNQVRRGTNQLFRQLKSTGSYAGLPGRISGLAFARSPPASRGCFERPSKFPLTHQSRNAAKIPIPGQRTCRHLAALPNALQRACTPLVTKTKPSCVGMPLSARYRTLVQSLQR